ncbi:hypothetical protein SAMN05421759_102584 [Roseivivax lentus]|uniref:Uncharacterized protein n=1 Tax=Roseivivax lentus TaxID=633194 RepID=A0A1N7LCN3_9RHOB|nr:hypothetical protein SAMN05421759_102584 [Roseivivax lentus]
MIHQIKTTIRRSQDTLWMDTLGVLSLVVMLVAGLHFGA